MTPSPGQRPTWGGVPLTRRRVLLGIGAIGGFLAVDLGAVAYAGGWIGTAHRLTPEIFMRAFEKVNGPQPGFRKNHAKGVSVSRLLRRKRQRQVKFPAPSVFRSGRTPVMGRFSLSGGNAHVADTTWAARGFGLAFGFPGGDAVAHRHAESPRLPRQFTAGVLRPATRLQAVTRHRQARPQGHGGIPCRAPGDREGHEDHRPESGLPWLCRQHVQQPQHVLLHQRRRRPNSGPLVAGSAHPAAAREVVGAQRAVRHPDPPDAFGPIAMADDAGDRHTVGSRSTTPPSRGPSNDGPSTQAR